MAKRKNPKLSLTTKPKVYWIDKEGNVWMLKFTCGGDIQKLITYMRKFCRTDITVTPREVVKQ